MAINGTIALEYPIEVLEKSSGCTGDRLLCHHRMKTNNVMDFLDFQIHYKVY